jgi:two-component system OmpR family sensor kinase
MLGLLVAVGLLAVSLRPPPRLGPAGTWSVAAAAELRSAHSAQQEELLIAVVHMERAAELAAERDHELRNGLAGLAGITHLLSKDTAGAEHGQLRHAVLAELGRLNDLLDPGCGGAEADAVDYRVEPVLAGLAILRRSAVPAVETDIDPGLRVVGDPAVLAQVVTNLLANCERHAPGARVLLRAHRSGDDAVVGVRDEGPGLAPGLEQVVLQRGVHDPATGGAGLGLHISRRLVEREGGTLRVRTVDGPRGCLATVTLPRARPRC